MYCRYCGAEMADDQAVCTACGEANAQPKKKMNWKPIVAAICCVALVVGLVAVMFGMNSGNDQVTAKASYTGTDAEVQKALDTVVATAGEFELTNRELQVAYWFTFYDFVSYYSDYVNYMIDFTKPLDQQMFNSEEGITWQQYFLEASIKTWHRYEVLVSMSQAAGIGMSKELEDYIAKLPEDMEKDLATFNFDNIEQLVDHDFGVGADYATYEDFMKLYHYSSEHYDRLYAELTADETEIEVYYANNRDAFVSRGCSKEDGSIVDVRHILVAPAEEEPYTDEQWAAAEKKANDLLNTWLQGSADEDAFAALAKTNSDCPSAADGGLIPDVLMGQMVQEFEDWCMAPHEYGDYDIIKTEFGYHLMFYIEGEELWHQVARSAVLSQKMGELLEAEEAKIPLKVDYSKIVLGDVKLT